MVHYLSFHHRFLLKQPEYFFGLLREALALHNRKFTLKKLYSRAERFNLSTQKLFLRVRISWLEFRIRHCLMPPNIKQADAVVQEWWMAEKQKTLSQATRQVQSSEAAPSTALQ